MVKNREGKGLKTIGLLGGMSWESTVTYYQIINEAVKREMGGLHSAKILLYSVDFAEIEECQAEGDWARSAEILSRAAKSLEDGGADFIIICTNTMHKIADEIARSISIPIVHIAEATSDSLKEKGIEKAALLGTKYTMTQDFYKNKLIEAGIDVIIPDDVDTVNDIIYNELCLGKVLEQSKAKYLSIIRGPKEKGAEAVILGCTEIGLLIKQEDTDLPVFDTTLIHAERAAKLSMD